MTQEDIEELVGVDQGTLSSWEKGEGQRAIPRYFLIAVAPILGVRVEWLETGSEMADTHGISLAVEGSHAAAVQRMAYDLLVMARALATQPAKKALGPDDAAGERLSSLRPGSLIPEPLPPETPQKRRKPGKGE